MPRPEPAKIAVIADAHFHDVDSDYHEGSSNARGTQLMLRSWADTRRSSRVFNESKAALETTLSTIGQRGISHVVLLGDYTDDGQIEATARLVELLAHYRQKFDMAFYAIPGNHDVYGPVGKHQSTRFTTTPGKTILVTSSAEVAATESSTSILTHNMYCEGIPRGLQAMAEFGLFRQDQYLYWETPFGQCDSVQSRQYDAYSADGKVARQLMDASYLVEPIAGLWLLMIDANVFEPRNGQWRSTQKKAFLNSSDAGWNSVLRVKPFLIDWIDNVCSRAEKLGKNLFSFSHYPVIDPFDDHHGNELTLFGNNENIKRRPDAKVAEKLSGAGVRLHFGGHLHVNGMMQKTINNHKITDIAVPSLVAFPACYKVIHSCESGFNIETVTLSDMSLDPLLIQHYRDENSATQVKDESALDSTSYGEFLYNRMLTRVQYHYLPEEWPASIAREIHHSSVADLVRFLAYKPTMSKQSNTDPLHFGPLADSLTHIYDPATLARLHAAASPYELSLDELEHSPMMSLIADWYCLRQAGDQALTFISSEKIRQYQFLAHTFGDLTPTDIEPVSRFFLIFLGELAMSLKRATDPRS